MSALQNVIGLPAQHVLRHSCVLRLRPFGVLSLATEE
jgi:hypothetical protein